VSASYPEIIFGNRYKPQKPQETRSKHTAFSSFRLLPSDFPLGLFLPANQVFTH